MPIAWISAAVGKCLLETAVKGPLLLECLAMGAKSYVEKPLRFDREDFIRDFKATLAEILTPG